jgi:hypothetical protein
VNRGTDYIFVAHKAHAQAKRVRSLASSCDAAQIVSGSDRGGISAYEAHVDPGENLWVPKA